MINPIDLRLSRTEYFQVLNALLKDRSIKRFKIKNTSLFPNTGSSLVNGGYFIKQDLETRDRTYSFLLKRNLEKPEPLRTEFSNACQLWNSRYTTIAQPLGPFERNPNPHPFNEEGYCYEYVGPSLEQVLFKTDQPDITPNNPTYNPELFHEIVSTVRKIPKHINPNSLPKLRFQEKLLERLKSDPLIENDITEIFLDHLQKHQETLLSDLDLVPVHGDLNPGNVCLGSSYAPEVPFTEQEHEIRLIDPTELQLNISTLDPARFMLKSGHTKSLYAQASSADTLKKAQETHPGFEPAHHHLTTASLNLFYFHRFQQMLPFMYHYLDPNSDPSLLRAKHNAQRICSSSLKQALRDMELYQKSLDSLTRNGRYKGLRQKPLFPLFQDFTSYNFPMGTVLETTGYENLGYAGKEYLTHMLKRNHCSDNEKTQREDSYWQNAVRDAFNEPVPS